MNNIKDFIGKEVKLFPHDTYWKNAILMDISEYGYVFKITKCEKGSGYNEGDNVFINHSMKVHFLINE